MKHIKVLVFILVLSLLMTSCGSQQSSGSHNDSSSPSVNDVLEEKTSESDNDTPEPSSNTESKTDTSDSQTSAPKPAHYDKVDIDLTALNSNLVYPQVYDMITEPDEYIGKTVKMSGQFAIYEGEKRVYCACIVADATACCSQGIEFILEGEPPYPEGYPELGEEITVAGVFDTYIETMAGQDFLYIQLINAELV
ncbi:MAG: hypothetical protein IJH64_11240 [Oscillospiraceae bacterium]|nr:hypothetical protein [Oscillospiraceae bacterium]MBR0450726.1 hypothetical protein [Oscillospiraceae bacterium]